MATLDDLAQAYAERLMTSGNPYLEAQYVATEISQLLGDHLKTGHPRKWG